MQSKQSQLILGYWPVRGAAHVTRLLLAYTGQEFVDKPYFDRPEWFEKDKKTLGLQFPNLPYLIDGDFKLTESTAIQNYVINKSGKTELLGKNAHDRAEVNRLIGVFNDTFKEIRGLFWNPDWKEVKTGLLEKVTGKLNELQHALGDKEYFLGYLTLVDFIFSEASYSFEVIYPEEYKKYTLFSTLRRSINNLPAIVQYYKRPNAVKLFFPPGYAKIEVPDWKEEPAVHKYEGVKLGYWRIRGLGQICRHLLAYAKVPFEDQAYTDPVAWGNDKVGLNIDFANLPYLITPEIKLSESTAIHRYIIDKWAPALLGKDIKDQAIIDEILGVFKDAFGDVIGLFFNPQHAEKSPAVLEKAKPKLDLLQNYIGEKETALGYLTYADFVFSEFSHYIEKLWPEQYKGWVFLQNIRKTVESLPEIKAYHEQAGAVTGPFLPPQRTTIHF